MTRHTLEYQLALKKWRRQMRAWAEDPVVRARLRRPIVGWFWVIYYGFKTPPYPTRELFDSIDADRFIK